jgi:hypothetical protein
VRRGFDSGDHLTATERGQPAVQSTLGTQYFPGSRVDQKSGGLPRTLAGGGRPPFSPALTLRLATPARRAGGHRS